MSERIMKNFPIVHEGNTYWRSRSCTTVGYVFCCDKDGYIYILANQRGPGAPTNVGKWNVPCGYLDFNEDGQHGVARETFEETGVKIDAEKFKFDSVSFSKEDDQNVNMRYWVNLDGTIDDYPLSNEANEEGETSDIRWIKICDIQDYEWAFGHQNTILEMANKHVHLWGNIMHLVQLDIIMHGTGKTISTNNLVICDSIDKCKEYTQQHINRMIEANSKSGITNDDYNLTDVDCVLTFHQEETTWSYWYNFIPLPKYS